MCDEVYGSSRSVSQPVHGGFPEIGNLLCCVANWEGGAGEPSPKPQRSDRASEPKGVSMYVEPFPFEHSYPPSDSMMFSVTFGHWSNQGRGRGSKGKGAVWKSLGGWRVCG